MADCRTVTEDDQPDYAGHADKRLNPGDGS